jgi:hypothetical protein
LTRWCIVKNLSKYWTPDDLPSWIEIARRERVAWKHRGVPMAERRPLLLRALERLYAARAPATEPRASIPESRAP